MAEIEIRGVAELLRRLGAAAGVDKLEPPMQRAVLRVQADMQTYPPAPRTSSYRRTGTYGRRWTTAIVRESGGVIGQIGNNTEYGPFVGSARFQRPSHRRSGWQTDEAVLERNRAAIVQDFEQAIQAALEK